MLECADLPRLIFARNKFQPIISRREHDAALIQQILLIYLLKPLGVEVHLRCVAQLRDRLAGGHRADIDSKIKFGLPLPMLFSPIERARGNLGRDRNVGLLLAQPKHPRFDRDRELDDRIVRIHRIG